MVGKGGAREREGLGGILGKGVSGRFGVMRIQSHEDLEVYQLAFATAMQIF
jgi:hypothetical protein